MITIYVSIDWRASNILKKYVSDKPRIWLTVYKENQKIYLDYILKTTAKYAKMLDSEM